MACFNMCMVTRQYRFRNFQQFKLEDSSVIPKFPKFHEEKGLEYLNCPTSDVFRWSIMHEDAIIP